MDVTDMENICERFSVTTKDRIIKLQDYAFVWADEPPELILSFDLDDLDPDAAFGVQHFLLTLSLNLNEFDANPFTTESDVQAVIERFKTFTRETALDWFRDFKSCRYNDREPGETGRFFVNDYVYTSCFYKIYDAATMIVFCRMVQTPENLEECKAYCKELNELNAKGELKQLEKRLQEIREEGL